MTEYAQQNESPEVCVGLAVYNGEDTLAFAIESILSQTFENIQLIISDNCSTDQTKEICLKYAKLDKRIKYYCQNKNVGLDANFINALDFSNAPYFMFASDDDNRKPKFISECLKKIKSDPKIALVYPKSETFDKNLKLIGIVDDDINATSNDPATRFRNVIWRLGICNLIFGLFKTDILKKSRTRYKSIFGDTLFLAEIALTMGKIVRIEDILFKRILTRDYHGYKNLDDKYTDLFSQLNGWFNEGMCLPYIHLTYAHIELVHHTDIEDQEKHFLMNDVLKCFKTRFGINMEYEIKRTIELINDGYFFYTWDKKQSSKWDKINLKTNDYFHMDNLLNHLKEALFIYPERNDLRMVYKLCLDKLSNFKGIQI